MVTPEERAGPLGYLSGHYSNAVTALCVLIHTRRPDGVEDQTRLEKSLPFSVMNNSLQSKKLQSSNC